MRLFVTGSGGFIGSVVCRLALARGHAVLGLEREARASKGADCEIATGSLEDMPWHQIEQFRPKALLHLAWTTVPGVHRDSPENAWYAGQSEALFHGCVARGIRHLAGAGTYVEYASSDAPLGEDRSALRPLCPYSRAKVQTMQRLSELAANAGLPWTWFRVFNAYGRGENPARLVPATMLALAAKRQAVLKTPDSVKDYIHVRDVALAMVLALEQGVTGPVNLGGGTGITVYDLACAAADIVGADRAEVIRTDPPASESMPVAVADTSKLRTTGWAPQVPLREGLQDLWESLRRGEGS